MCHAPAKMQLYALRRSISYFYHLFATLAPCSWADPVTCSNIYWATYLPVCFTPGGNNTAPVLKIHKSAMDYFTREMSTTQASSPSSRVTHLRCHWPEREKGSPSLREPTSSSWNHFFQLHTIKLTKLSLPYKSIWVQRTPCRPGKIP